MTSALVQPLQFVQLDQYPHRWENLVEPLRKGKHLIQDVGFLTIPGDQPKCFIRIQEFRPGRPGARQRHWVEYIAKVGAKNYPIESITEHLLTRLGQCLQVNVAESTLKIVGGQVRFLSKFFLKREKQRLVHGLDIFRRHLDDSIVEEIAQRKVERDFYTFQTVFAAVRDVFPDQHMPIMHGVTRMIAFDAVVGNNDRHPANWGVIEPVRGQAQPYFSPVFDSARGLFWNNNEARVRNVLLNPPMLRAYVRKSFPLISWDGKPEVDHFELVGGIYRDFPDLREDIECLVRANFLSDAAKILEEEFGALLTADRRKAILQCLELRYHRFLTAIQEAKVAKGIAWP
jgi:hypothetical protein